MRSFKGSNQDRIWLILDVREPEEWYAGHIAQATFLARGRIEGRIEEMFPNKDASHRLPLSWHREICAGSADTERDGLHQRELHGPGLQRLERARTPCCHRLLAFSHLNLRWQGTAFPRLFGRLAPSA